MKKRLYYKSLIFKELNIQDISFNYLNWFKKKERVRFIIKKPNSLLDLKKFVKKSKNDNEVILVGIFDNMNNHLGNVKFDQFDHKKKSCTVGIMTGQRNKRNYNYSKDLLLGSIKFFQLLKGFKTFNLGVNVLNFRAKRFFLKSGFRMKKNYSNIYVMSLNHEIKKS